jgi:hypothetical protein
VPSNVSNKILDPKFAEDSFELVDLIANKPIVTDWWVLANKTDGRSPKSFAVD